MGANKTKTDWIKVKVSINKWVYDTRLVAWAKDNDMTITAAIRFMINQFFKDKHY